MPVGRDMLGHYGIFQMGHDIAQNIFRKVRRLLPMIQNFTPIPLSDSEPSLPANLLEALVMIAEFGKRRKEMEQREAAEVLSGCFLEVDDAQQCVCNLEL